MRRMTKFVASLLPFSLVLMTMCAGVLGVTLLGDGALAETTARSQARERREAWTAAWRAEPREEVPVGLRFVRDPMTGCEYIVVPEGITPRIGRDGQPYCPVRIETEAAA